MADGFLEKHHADYEARKAAVAAEEEASAEGRTETDRATR